MKSKAQVTVFILVGILIVAASGLIYYIVAEPEISLIKTSQSDSISVYVEECVKKAAVNAAYFFGFQQGYYGLPEKYLETEDSTVSYFYYLGDDVIPLDNVFEEEFGKIMEDELIFECTDFSSFEADGYEIFYEQPEVRANILEEEVSLEINFPLTISKGEDTQLISRFSYDLPYRIGHILDVSRELIAAVVEEPYALDLTLFLNQDIDVSVFNYDACNQVYILLDEESKLNEEDEDYVFSFAVLLEEEYCQEEGF